MLIKTGELSLANNTKTKKPRVIYVSDRAQKAIKKAFESDLRNRSKNAYVFRARDDGRTPLSANYLQVKVNAHMRKAL